MNLNKSTNFFERIEMIISFYGIKNINDFSLNYLGYKSSEKINRLKKEGTSPSFEILSDISNKFEKIDVEWLLTGKGNMLKEDKKKYGIHDRLQTITEPTVKYENKKKSDLISIPIVEIYGAAGNGFMNNESLIPTGEINLPKEMVRSGGLRYCIRVKGFSMAPTLQDSDFLIIRHLSPNEWRTMSDEHVYLVVDKDGMAYVKRVKNRLSRGFIVLTSDSIEKSSYPNFNLQAEEIANIFYAEWHFSAKMQNINETYYDRLKSLEDRFDNIENIIKIEKNK